MTERRGKIVGVEFHSPFRSQSARLPMFFSARARRRFGARVAPRRRLLAIWRNEMVLYFENFTFFSENGSVISQTSRENLNLNFVNSNYNPTPPPNLWGLKRIVISGV